MRGKFVVIEGIRGSGKTTLINEAKKEFRDLDITYVQDMGSLPICRSLRRLLLHPDAAVMARLAISMAGKVELQRKIIEPALRSGSHVICERWCHSADAYLLYPNRIPPEISEELRHLFSILEPDLTIIRSVDFSVSMERLDEQDRDRNVFEESVDYMRDVCAYYNGFCDGLPADTIEVGLGHLRHFFAGTGGD